MVTLSLPYQALCILCKETLLPLQRKKTEHRQAWPKSKFLEMAGSTGFSAWDFSEMKDEGTVTPLATSEGRGGW